MASASVLDIGQCGYDHSRIRAMIENAFDAQVSRAVTAEEAIEALQANKYDLVLINRVLDGTEIEGTTLIKQMSGNDEKPVFPVMLISDRADAQEQAAALGAAPGFGKAGLSSAETQARLAEYLPRRNGA